MKFKLLKEHYIKGGYREKDAIVDLDCKACDAKEEGQPDVRKVGDSFYKGSEFPSTQMEVYKGPEPGVEPAKQGKEPIKNPG